MTAKAIKCFKVFCKDELQNSHDIEVMASDEFSAKHIAEYAFREGKHIVANAVETLEIKQ